MSKQQWQRLITSILYLLTPAIAILGKEWFQVPVPGMGEQIVMMRKTSVGPPTCYEYQVLTSDKARTVKSKSFCYPSIIITGRRKCGTSAMYQLLSASANVVPSHKLKEHCNIVAGSMLGFLDDLPSSVSPRKQILSGCPDIASNMRLHSWLKQPKTKYIYLIRDYADWLWAAYNYWCASTYEECHSTKTDPKHNTRSPELFHQLVLDTDARNTTKTLTPVTMFEMHGKTPCEYGDAMFLNDIRLIWNYVKPVDTLILASEDIEEKLDESVKRIVSVVNITLTKEAVKAFGAVRYNTQVSELSKMTTSKVAADQMVNGRYAISGFRPMLNETKQLLDRCWLKDCIWVSAITGRAYEACSSVHKHYDVLAEMVKVAAK